jgi:cell division protein FtsW (lipid II flippase)
MSRSTTLLLIGTLLAAALPALLASVFVLSIADVGGGTWLVQAGSIAMMVALATGGGVLARRPSRRGVMVAAGATLLLCALPLLGSAQSPERWVVGGPVSLYVAPVCLPALLSLVAWRMRRDARLATGAAAALWAVALVLAAQPDLSQVLALTAGALVIIALDVTPWWRRVATMAPFVVAVVLAQAQGDPLQPVGHVELVVAVAWQHSMLAGVCVLLATLVFVGTLAWRLGRLDPAQGAVAAYYAVLFAGAMAGLTPAPLIGYGAGPWLGFGLWIGTIAAVAQDVASPVDRGRRVSS